MAFDEEKQIKLLLNEYEKAFDKIRDRILKKIDSPTNYNRAYDVALLQDISKIIAKLDKQVDDYAPNVQRLYKRTREEEMASLAKRLGQALPSEFTKRDEETINLLTQTLTGNLKKANNVVGRKVRDVYQQTIVRSSLNRALTSDSLTKALDDVVKSFKSQNIFSFTDKAGKLWNIERYSAMALYTTQGATVNRATFNGGTDYEIDLYKMTSHSSSCPVCAPYESKVYSLSGKSKEYPSVNSINGGNVTEYGTLHPFCRHRLTPYIPALDQNLEKTKEFSNKKIEDERSKTSKENYDKRQKMNRWKVVRTEIREEIKLIEAVPTKSRTAEQRARLGSLKDRRKQYNDKIKSQKEWRLDS